MTSKLHKYINYFIISLTSITVSACVTRNNEIFQENMPKIVIVPDAVKKEYAAVNEGKFFLPAIDMSTIEKKYWRRVIDYPTSYPIGTILVDTDNRFLYLIQPNGKAIRYGVGVGRQGLALTGTSVVGAKIKWPHWSPTKDMMVRDPDLYGNMKKGLEPGVDNPLGARALYLYKNGSDSHFRIHGSHEAWSIGKAMSSGCIRMLNQDVIDLYNHAKVGSKVIILNHNKKDENPDTNLTIDSTVTHS